MRVLAVADEPDLLSSLLKALREDGYAVDGAPDGEDGLDKAESYDYDAVVLESLLRPRPPRPPQGRFPDEPPGQSPAPPFGRQHGSQPGEPREDRRFDSPDFLQNMREMVQQGGVLDASQPNTFYYILWQGDGAIVARSPGAPDNVPAPTRVGAPEPQALQGRDAFGKGSPAMPGPGLPPEARTRGQMREAYRFLPHGQCLLVGRSLVPDLAAMRRLALWLTAAGATELLLGLAGGWWVATRAIRPINAISATAVRIADGDLSQRISAADSRERSSVEYREALEVCQRAARRMKALTESLLELARLDAGQKPIKRERFDLAGVARDCVELLRPLAAERGIQIHGDVPPMECLGDAERIGQVVTNPLTNAIHFNRDQGEVRLSARAEHGGVLLTVADTGQGIPVEDIPHLFERFYRVDKSRSRIQGRNGLGLAICKAIVDAHGGTIDVASQAGVGTTFTVRLPLT
jgi:two-component system, OmpR family, sensor kinase